MGTEPSSPSTASPTPGCSSCQAAPPAPAGAATPANALAQGHHGTYAAAAGSLGLVNRTFTHVTDQTDDTSHWYLTRGIGAQVPGAGVSAGEWSSTGNADDYWLGHGNAVGAGPFEGGWNSSGVNQGAGWGVGPKGAGAGYMSTETVRLSDMPNPTALTGADQQQRDLQTSRDALAPIKEQQARDAAALQEFMPR